MRVTALRQDVGSPSRTRRCPIARTTSPATRPESRTATAVSINQLDIEVALLAKTLADVTDRRPRTTWDGESPRDSTAAPRIAEVLSWLPGTAVLLFGRQNAGACQLIAAVGDAYAQVGAYGDHVDVVVAADEPEEAQALGQGILERVPAPRDLPDNVHLCVWSKGSDGPEVNRSLVSVPRWPEVEGNYPGHTHHELAELMKHTPDDGRPGRLVLFHGPPGTGKTHAIRALMAEWQTWCDPELVVDPENALFDYPYLQRLISSRRLEARRRRGRWRLVVAEDADRFLRSHDRQAGNEALDRLLNATDGILAQGSTTIFLLTTNVELSTINPALARPGRCLAAVEFELFKPSEARGWLGVEASPPGHRLTLAELYEMKSGARREIHRARAEIGQYL